MPQKQSKLACNPPQNQLKLLQIGRKPLKTSHNLLDNGLKNSWKRLWKSVRSTLERLEISYRRLKPIKNSSKSIKIITNYPFKFHFKLFLNSSRRKSIFSPFFDVFFRNLKKTSSGFLISFKRIKSIGRDDGSIEGYKIS